MNNMKNMLGKEIKYKDIIAYGKAQGYSISSCCIANVLRKWGVPLKRGSATPNKRKCSANQVQRIEAALRHFRIIP